MGVNWILLLHLCTLLGFEFFPLFFWQGFRQYVIYTKYIDEIKLLPTCHTLLPSTKK
jgi:hypothetical protein